MVGVDHGCSFTSRSNRTLPYHYMGHFEFNWVTHLGPIYLATVVFVVGALLALRAMMTR
jgi:hypothetical protein